GSGAPMSVWANRFAKIVGSRFEKVAGSVMRSGRIAVHFERTISSTFSGLSGLNRMPMVEPDYMFRLQFVITLACKARTSLTGNSSNFGMFRKDRGEATETTILSLRLVARLKNR